MSDWREIIAGAASDRQSGSWAIAKRAAAGLALAAGEGEPALREAIERLLAGQPAMAALWNLANAVAWAAIDAGAGAQAAADTAREFVRRGERNAQAIARHADGLLRLEAERAVTLSASSVVEAALRRWRGPVLVLESRPRLEGRDLARRLAGDGLRVSLAVDAAARVLLDAGDVVVLGADSVTPHGVSNKIGSWALAAAARERGRPVHALAGPEKWWPLPLPDTSEADRDAREVLPDPIPGVKVRNPYFEVVPFDLLSAVITPNGPLPARQVPAALASWRIHPWLQTLAGRHGDEEARATAAGASA